MTAGWTRVVTRWSCGCSVVAPRREDRTWTEAWRQEVRSGKRRRSSQIDESGRSLEYGCRACTNVGVRPLTEKLRARSRGTCSEGCDAKEECWSIGRVERSGSIKYSSTSLKCWSEASFLERQEAANSSSFVVRSERPTCRSRGQFRRRSG